MQHPDFNLIFVHVLNAARKYLEERGDIPVFAYVLPVEDEDQLRRVVVEENSGQTAQEVVERLRAILKGQSLKENFRAVAIISPAQPDGNGNGSISRWLQVEVDHSEASPIVWQVPFQRVGDRYKFGTTDGGGIMKPGKHFVF